MSDMVLLKELRIRNMCNCYSSYILKNFNFARVSRWILLKVSRLLLYDVVVLLIT
jgi:hypothetical protein